MFNLPPKDEGVGIVMRYEGGGSLEALLHSDPKPLPMIEKIRLLTLIAQAMVELHSSGIIHADIKSGNILLSHHSPPEIRLADFGLSVMKDITSETLGASTLLMTAHRRGTPIYSAPEMLVNPYDEYFDGQVAQCSRKTDMYSFGILAWEVLARQRPFADIKNEPMLCGKVHKGARPPIDSLPPDTPASVRTMIEACWSKDRALRLSAVECSSILQYSYDFLSKGQFDVFFSHAWTMKPLLSHVYYLLTRLGYRVWYDQNEMGHDMVQSMKQGIASSKVVIICLSKTFQKRENCMFELREAAVNNPKPIVTIVTDDNPFNWATNEVQDLCQLRTRLYVNLANVAKLNWSDEGGPSPEMLKSLKDSLGLLFRVLNDHDCTPSMSHSISRSGSSMFSLSNSDSSVTSKPLTIWLRPVCPGLKVKIKATPNSNSANNGELKSDQQIEVYIDKEQGYYRLVDGTVSNLIY
jgi:serine/threonine protein kinase